MIRITRQRRGAVALITIIVVSVFAVAIMTAVSLTAGRGLTTISTASAGERAFAAAEAGLLDALYRIGSNSAQGSFTTTFDGFDITVTITPSGFQRNVRSSAHHSSTGITRTVAINVANTSFGGGFSGAAQAAAELIAVNNATINGDTRVGDSTTSGRITAGNNADFNGHVWVSGSTGFADNVTVVGNHDIHVHTLQDSTIGRHAYYFDENNAKANGGSELCGSSPGIFCHPGSSDPSPEEFPITISQIQTLAAEIQSVGETPCNSGTDYIVTNQSQMPSGPTKLPCNLVINSGDQLTLNGNLWVTGGISFPHPNVKMWLPSSFNGQSAFIISGDPTTPGPAGKVDIDNNTVIQGSDHGTLPDPLDFIFFISMSNNDSLSPLAYAIRGRNNSEAAVYFAPWGLIEVVQNGALNNTTGHRIYLLNNATLNFTTGLSQFFLSPTVQKPPVADPASWQEL